MRLKLKKHVMWILSLILIFCLGISASADSGDTTTVNVPVTYGQTEARSMLQMINDFRTGSDAWYWDSSDTEKTVCTGLSELTYDYNLEQIAMQRAAEIAISFSHTRPNGKSCFTASCNGTSSMGENIAAGYRTASDVFTGWQETDDSYSGQGHRRNMLNAGYTAVGIGHVYYNGRHYWVQEFGYRVSSAASSSANDSLTNVPVEVLSSSITVSSVTPGSSACTVAYGDSVEVPKATVVMKVASNKVTSEVTPDWTVSDSTIAAISSGNIVGKKAGTTSLTANVQGEEISISLTVTPISLKDEVVSLAASSYVYARNAVTPEPIVTWNGTTLVKNTDYTVTYKNNTKPGTAELTVSGIGNFTGSVTKTFTIVCNHKYDSGTVTKAATCIAEGVKTYTCTICGETKTEVIGTTSHTAVVDKAVAATCTATGLTEGSHCSVCGTVLVKQETTKALGHSWGDYVENKAATCSEYGEETRTCSVCGEKETRKLDKLEHTKEVDKAVAATCTATGLTEGSHCSVCNTVLKKQEVTAQLAHTKKTTVTRATTSKDGKIVTTCTECKNTFSTTTIAKVSGIKLSATSYTYNGKAITPSVSVTDGNGKKLSSADYKVSYASGRKSVGKYAVKITLKGNYSGSKTLYFNILPKGTSLKTLTASSKGFTAAINKQTTQTTGYQIQYSTSSKFANAKTVAISKNTTVSKKITKLTAKKKYYVRVRTYKTVKVNGKSVNLYSGWSSAKTVTTKK